MDEPAKATKQHKVQLNDLSSNMLSHKEEVLL